MSHDQPELASTKLDVSGLLDQPGAHRQVELTVGVPEGFEVPLTEFTGDVTIDGVLESLVDGVLLRGSVETGVVQQCASCLTTLPASTVTAAVAELFSDPSSAEEKGDIEEGYEIVDSMVDADALIRDALAGATDLAPKCRPDCAGICPGCGVDRNTTACECADTVIDDRWAALENLQLGQ